MIPISEKPLSIPMAFSTEALVASPPAIRSTPMEGIISRPFSWTSALIFAM